MDRKGHVQNPSRKLPFFGPPERKHPINGIVKLTQIPEDVEDRFCIAVERIFNVFNIFKLVGRLLCLVFLRFVFPIFVCHRWQVEP